MPASLPRSVESTLPAVEPQASTFASEGNLRPVQAESETVIPPAPAVTLMAPLPAPYETETWSRVGGPPVPGFAEADHVECGECQEATGRFYGGIDYLLWWIQGDRVPPLLTTGQPASQGILGRPGTTVLFGGTGLDNNPYSGLRATFGYWCDCSQQIGIEVSGFVLPGSSSTFTANSNEFPVLARPFFSVNPGANFGESRELATFPGVSQGSVSITNSSDLWGLEANLRHCLCSGCTCDGLTYHLDVIAGPRVLGLNESLTIVENLNSIVPGVDPALPNGGSAFVYDRFCHQQLFLRWPGGP